MPTGYTAPVKDGEITELEPFVLSCARAFGALVLLRDSDQSLEATRRYVETGAYLDTSDYHERDLVTARQRLAELEAMTDTEADTAARAAADDVATRNQEIEAERAESQRRYEAMIAKVEAWEPPSADHVEFKEFMLKQLRESIDFDCHPFALTVPEIAGWRERQIKEMTRRIARAEEEIEKQRERNEARRSWVEGLLDSLEAVPA